MGLAGRTLSLSVETPLLNVVPQPRSYVTCGVRHHERAPSSPRHKEQRESTIVTDSTRTRNPLRFTL